MTVVALLLALIGATGVPAPAAAAARVPKVALVVGPAGSLTNTYRALADEAATAARNAGAEVVRVYSPNATWPAVKQAVTGASIVVYLGHGNGWPSPYRNSLYPPTQNGFGLNPVAGRDDSTHQYFGEASVGKLQLAPNAVVILSHLCYASGNAEPGQSEGTTTQAVQRVDNFAAGFLKAGAKAVVAEAYLGPAYYVRSLLGDRGSIEAIWSRSPAANDRHPIAAPSVRTPGYTLHLDPDHAASGFVRSLVSRGVTAAEMRAGATGSAGAAPRTGPFTPVAGPTLASAGVRFGEPAFQSLPIAGDRTQLTLPFTAGNRTLVPAGTEMSIRWDLIVPDPVAGGVDSAAEPTPSPSVSPAPTETTGPELAPTATPIPAAPEVDLVVPEQQGSVVEPARATRTTAGLRLTVRYPAKAGLYRLSLMLHTPDGVAYDSATQDLLVPMLVQVGGPVAAAYGVNGTIELGAGSLADMPVRVLNAGSEPWDSTLILPPTVENGHAALPYRTAVLPAQLVATWISTGWLEVPSPISVVMSAEAAAPGSSTEVMIPLVAPALPGDYLLVLDVLSSVDGPLSALGSAPAIVRVTVVAPPSPSVSPIAVPKAPQPLD